MDAIQNTSNRIAYIDLFKGIAIIGVVWVHSHIPPSWLTPFLVNSIFFLSQAVFQQAAGQFYNLIIKNTKRILIPFLFFYVLSYPFRIIVHFWDYRTLSNSTGFAFSMFFISTQSLTTSSSMFPCGFCFLCFSSTYSTLR